MNLLLIWIVFFVSPIWGRRFQRNSGTSNKDLDGSPLESICPDYCCQTIATSSSLYPQKLLCPQDCCGEARRSFQIQNYLPSISLSAPEISILDDMEQRVQSMCCPGLCCPMKTLESHVKQAVLDAHQNNSRLPPVRIVVTSSETTTTVAPETTPVSEVSLTTLASSEVTKIVTTPGVITTPVPEKSSTTLTSTDVTKIVTTPGITTTLAPKGIVRTLITKPRIRRTSSKVPTTPDLPTTLPPVKATSDVPGLPTDPTDSGETTDEDLQARILKTTSGTTGLPKAPNKSVRRISIFRLGRNETLE